MDEYNESRLKTLEQDLAAQKAKITNLKKIYNHKRHTKKVQIYILIIALFLEILSVFSWIDIDNVYTYILYDMSVQKPSILLMLVTFTALIICIIKQLLYSYTLKNFFIFRFNDRP